MSIQMSARIVVALLVIGASFSVEAKDVMEIDPESLHVAMFKNGVGVVTMRTELPDPEGSYRFRPLPQASLGSFWMSWPKDLDLSGIKATQATSTATVKATNLIELLEANIGYTIDLKMDDTTRLLSAFRGRNPVRAPLHMGHSELYRS